MRGNGRSSPEDPWHRPAFAHHRVRDHREKRQQARLRRERLHQIRRRRAAGPSENHPGELARSHRAASAAPDRAGESLRQRQSRIDARARPGARHRDLRGRGRRAAGFRVHRAPGEAGRGRQRPREEGAGAADGEAAPRACGRALRGCRGRPRLRDLPRARRTGPGRDRYARLPREAGQAHMIGRLAGVLLEKNPPQILVEAGGVGYEVEVPMSTFYNLPGSGERVTLLTHLVVREDAHLLYGFGTDAERRAFRQLLKISGVGPRIALAVLSGLSVAELVAAVAAQEAGRLVRVPGIGKKTAERLLLELKGKLGAEALSGVAINRPRPVASDVMTALLALGYSDKEAQLAVKHLPEGLTVSESIRQALRSLSKA